MANPIIPNLDGSNPGPASISTLNTQLIAAPQAGSNINFGSGVTQGSNALRLLAVARAINLTPTGDIAVVPIINSTLFTVATVVFSNGLVAGVSGSVAAENLGVFTAAAAGGTAVRTAGVLTGMTSTAVALVNTGAVPGSAWAISYLYVNSTVAVATGTVDMFVYGYDLS